MAVVAASVVAALGLIFIILWYDTTRLRESLRAVTRSGDVSPALSELLHAVEKAVLTADSTEIGEADLPLGALGAPESLLATAVESRWTLRQLSDAYIVETLRRAGGNRSLAAKRLGVSRKFLWERGKK